MLQVDAVMLLKLPPAETMDGFGSVAQVVLPTQRDGAAIILALAEPADVMRLDRAKAAGTFNGARESMQPCQIGAVSHHESHHTPTAALDSALSRSRSFTGSPRSVARMRCSSTVNLERG